MTAVAVAPGPDEPDDRQPAPRWWRPVGQFVCGAAHEPAGAALSGRLEESARRLSHEELAAASVFVSEGHTVRSLRPGRGGGRTADLEVCSIPVEVKSFLDLEERDGRPPSPFRVYNKLLDAGGQGRVAVVTGFGSGLTESAARQAMAMFSAQPKGRDLAAVRILGDDFSLSWGCEPEFGVARDADRPVAGAARPVDGQVSRAGRDVDRAYDGPARRGAASPAPGPGRVSRRGVETPTPQRLAGPPELGI